MCIVLHENHLPIYNNYTDFYTSYTECLSTTEHLAVFQLLK